MKFLIYVDGSQVTAAAQLGETLARLAGAETTRLRVIASAREAAGHRGSGSLLRVGSPVPEILAEAARGNFDLIFIGDHPRHRLTERVWGSPASRLAKQSATPLFIVKSVRPVRAIQAKGPHSGELPLQKILVCTGGEAPGEYCALWGGRVAAWTGARITLLHVMSQVALTEKANLDDLNDTAEEAIRAQTREGQHLQRAIQLAKEANAATEVKPKIRHGLVLDEILAEINAGDYDLVALGAHFAPNNDPWRGLLLADLTDQLIARCPRNVLVVRKNT